MSKLRFLPCLALAALLVPGCAVFGSKEADEKLESELAGLMLDHQILETRLSLAEDRIIALQTQVNEVQDECFKDLKKPETPKPVPAKKSAPPAGSGDMGTDYKNALDAFMARKYKESEAMFKAFMQKYPKSKLMPNAGYWLGECHYAQGRFDEAILSFQSVTRAWPKHHKAADSLVKTGYSYVRLGDKANARFYLEQVLVSYPGSRAAALAQAELDRL